jgi:hypothetical protein
MGGSSKGGGGPSGTTTSVQDSSPWGPQQPYLTDIFANASNLYHNYTPEFAPFRTAALPNWAQVEATDAMMHPERYPERTALPAAATANNAAIAGGEYLWKSPGAHLFGSLAGTESPEAAALQSYLRGDRLGGAGNPYTDALSESVLSRVVPGIQSRFISGGSLNSPEAARATAAGATSALAPLLFQQQQQEEQNQIAASKQLGDLRMSAGNALNAGFTSNMNDMMRAIALAPQTDALSYSPEQRKLEAANLNQQWEQQALNEGVSRWNFAEELPYQQLNNFIGAVTGNYGGNSVLTQPYFKPPGQSPLGAIGQGLGVLGGIPSAISGVSSLFGLFGGSDRRMKDDIKSVGKLDNGLRVYSYRYKDDPMEMKRIGVMADEVEEVHPEAVTTLPGAFGHLAGLKVVDYDRATA